MLINYDLNVSLSIIIKLGKRFDFLIIYCVAELKTFIVLAECHLGIRDFFCKFFKVLIIKTILLLSRLARLLKFVFQTRQLLFLRYHYVILKVHEGKVPIKIGGFVD